MDNMTTETATELRALAKRLEAWVIPGAVLCIQAASEIDHLRAALQEIADEDYRGNRPHSATIAFNALKP